MWYTKHKSKYWDVSSLGNIILYNYHLISVQNQKLHQSNVKVIIFTYLKVPDTLRNIKTCGHSNYQYIWPLITHPLLCHIWKMIQCITSIVIQVHTQILASAYHTIGNAPNPSSNASCDWSVCPCTQTEEYYICTDVQTVYLQNWMAQTQSISNIPL